MQILAVLRWPLHKKNLVTALNSPPPQGVANLCEHVGNAGLLTEVLFLLSGQIIIYLPFYTSSFSGRKNASRCLTGEQWDMSLCKGEGQGFYKAMKMLTGKLLNSAFFFLFKFQNQQVYKDKQLQYKEVRW